MPRLHWPNASRAATSGERIVIVPACKEAKRERTPMAVWTGAGLSAVDPVTAQKPQSILLHMAVAGPGTSRISE